MDLSYIQNLINDIYLSKECLTRIQNCERLSNAFKLIYPKKSLVCCSNDDNEIFGYVIGYVIDHNLNRYGLRIKNDIGEYLIRCDAQSRWTEIETILQNKKPPKFAFKEGFLSGVLITIIIGLIFSLIL